VRTAMAGLLVCSACSGPVIDTDPTVLGTVAAAGVSCPSDAPSGATCTSLTVECPRLDDLSVTAIVTEPATSAIATILLHNNVGGEQLLDSGFVDAYTAAGFRVVQAEWQSDWEQSDVGVKHAACRFATLLEWIFTNVHQSDRTHGFCAQSWGGGSGGLAFALSHYRAGAILDAITVSAGPPFARIDLGCTPSAPSISPCATAASVPVDYSGGVLQIISTWEEAPSCGSSSPAPSEIVRWQHDSVLSSEAVLAFPQTSLAAWYCTTDDDATIGQGSLFFSRVTSEANVHCITGGNAGACSGETPWPGALPDMVADMTTRCVPRH
jgi:hypothetical protein